MSKSSSSVLQHSTLKAVMVSIVLAGLVSLGYYNYLKSRISASNAQYAKSFEQSFTAALEQYSYLPSILSRSLRVKNLITNPASSHIGLSEHFQEIANEAGADAIYLMNADGTVVASSNYDQENSFYAKNYAFRPYFSRAIAQSEQQYYYAKGATSGIPGFFISSPVIFEAAVKGVVVIKLDLREWQTRWGGQDSAVAVADENGVVILSSQADWLYRLIKPLPNEQFSLLVQSKQFPGEALSNLRSDPTPTILGEGQTSQWLIDGADYNVSGYRVLPPNWTFYFLLTHQSLLAKTAWVFLAVALCLLLIALLMSERRLRIESNMRTLQLKSRQRKDLVALINNIEVGVFLCDQKGKVLTVNRQACSLLDKPEKQLNGQNIRELIEINQDQESGVLSSMNFTDTFSVEAQQAKLPVMVSSRSMKIEEQDCYLFTAVNIERRKQAEQKLMALNESLEELVSERTKELENAQEALLRRNKVMALGNLSAVVVHELSQPLSAMNSLVATIQNKMALRNYDGVAQSAKRIQPISEKMDGIIKMLKHYSYFDSGSTGTYELYGLVNQSIELLHESLGDNNVRLEFEQPKDALFVQVNQLKFDLLISNIIRNAIDAVSEKSEPRIDIEISTKDELTQEGNVSVLVRDNGDGIDDSIIEHLFDAFQTTKQVGKGMGLGLSVANEIATEFGGRIEAKNHKGGGEFCVTLPKASALGVEKVERAS